MKKFRLVFILFFIFVFVTQIGTSNQTGTVSKKPPKKPSNLEIIAGRNVNMVSGTQLPYGDPWLQRQNEPSIAVSTRNPLHLLAGANDYRTIDIPGKEGDELPGQEEGETAQAPREPWVGVFKSFDGGKSWITTLLPGYPQDFTREGMLVKTDISNVTNGIPLNAAADPVVRAGPNGLFYYCGIAFDRETKNGVLFVSRFIDNNNLERNTKEEDCIKYLDTKIIAAGLGGEFIDKPWIAVDMPRSDSTVFLPLVGEVFPEVAQFNVFIVYSVFTGEKSEIRYSKSEDSGQTWSASEPLAEASGKGYFDIAAKKEKGIFQGATLAFSPKDGSVNVAWRQFDTDSKKSEGGIYFARTDKKGKKFEKIEEVEKKIEPFDQGSSTATFRTNSYPTMAIDEDGTIYLAWAEREKGKDGQAHIVITSSKDGKKWGKSKEVEKNKDGGHQFMPSLTYAGGKLMLVWYDQRNDFSQRFTEYIDDISGEPRHTIDVRAAQASPGKDPKFESSKQISRYSFVLTGDRGNYSAKQVQYNFVNFQIFKSGTWPFIGDYIDIAPSPMFVIDGSGKWRFNTEPSDSTVYHAAWTDNRDVRPPVAGSNWTMYAPPSSNQEYPFDQTNFCWDWTNAGMRNQNIYTSRITQGIIVGSPGNAKTLGTLGKTLDGENIPRAFVVFVKNTTDQIKSFRLTIANQPSDAPEGRASFLEFEELVELDVQVPPRSSISRSVFIYSSIPNESVRVDVAEIDVPYGGLIPGGLESKVVFNPDIMNPDIMNPDIMNPDIMNPDIMNAEVHNPDIMNLYVNPDIMNPDIMNPDIMNPDIMNPDIMNPDIMNPDIMNPDIMNPDIMNPDIMNPDIMNPDIMNPDIMNPAIDDPLAGQFIDIAWKVLNNGNTSSTFEFKTLSTAAQEDGTLPEGIQAQLLIYNIYKTPNEYDGPNSCALGTQEHHDLVVNIINPDIMNPDIMNPDIMNPDIMNPDIMNATFALAPGDEAKVILRLWKPNQSGVLTTASGEILDFQDANNIFENFRSHVSSTSRNSEDLEVGITTYPDDSSTFMIDTKIMKSGEVNQFYSDFLTASGGKEPYSWAVLDSLPSGLQLNSNTGQIWGPPTTAGTYTFEAQVKDDSGQIRTKEVWINILPVTGGFIISGRITSSPTVGIEGVELTGLPGNPVITDNVGYYTGFVSSGWTGTVTPAKSGDYTFIPSSRTYSNVTSEQTMQNYSGTSPVGALDHFDIDTISNQTSGTAFSVTITAKDSGGNTVTSYTGSNTLSDTTGSINPTSTGSFVNGAWTGNVTITNVQTGVTISTTGDNKNGTSNSFDVISGLPQDDSYEENDDFGSASDIPTGTYANLQLFDDDWFKISVNAGMYLKVTIIGVSKNDIDLGLADSTGKFLVGGFSSSNTETIYYNTPSAGDYYIRVPYTWGGALQNTYTLTVEVSYDFGLGHVYGTVTDTSGTTPLHVRVRVIDEYGFRRWNTLTDASTGEYKISIPAGSYKIQFMTYPILDYYSGINYLNEYYDDKYPSSMASLVEVLAGGDLYNIDGHLEPGGTISGTVTDNGSPINGAYVRIRDLHGYSVASAYTDVLGQYTIERRHPGYFKAYVRSMTDNHGMEWYNDKSSFDEANAFYVDSSQPATGVNFQLTVGGSVAGTVTDGSGGIGGIQVIAYDPSQTIPFLYPSAQIPQIGLWNTWTDSNGNYVLDHLPPGDVKIYFNTPNTHHVPEWYDDKPDFEDSVAVTIQSGVTIINKNAELAEGGAIGGRVTDSSVNGIKNVLIWIFHLDGWGYYQKYVYTDDEGYYYIDGVPAGNVKVRFRPNNSSSPPENWAVQWYNDKNSYPAANNVSVVANQTTWGIDAVLADNGGRVEGYVRNIGGQGIPGVRVVAYDSSIQAQISFAYTDADGYYSVQRIPTCDVKLAFYTGTNKLPYLSEFYNDSPSYAGADPASVVLGAATPLSDVVLSARPNLTVTTTSLPDGDVGTPYSQALLAMGGTLHYYWSLFSGSLPDGLSLHGNGKIDGTPTVQGEFNFSVQVVDYSYPPQSDTLPLSITINDDAAASKLVFTQQPGGGTAGTVWVQQPVVEVQDGFGNTIVSDNSTEITLAIDTNPGGGTLSGTIPVTVSAGVATFTDLSIDNLGSGYTLEATSSPSYTSDTSAAFDVNAKITGTVMFNELAVTGKTKAEASFFVSGLSGHTTEYSTSSGIYTIYNVPPGAQYSISTSIDTSTPTDDDLYPGEFYGYRYALDVPAGQAVVNENLNVEQVMHLTGPIDNNVAQPWPVYPYDGYTSPVLFDWDALIEAATYQVIVSRSNGSTVQVVNTSGITNTQASIPLPVSVVGEHYQFEIWAYNGNSVRVGRFMIVYTSGYGWDYRFRVISPAISNSAKGNIN